MTLREVTSLEAAGEAAARVCMITVFPAGSDWIVKLDACAEPGEGLRRFASREQAVMFARSLAHAHRPDYRTRREPSPLVATLDGLDAGIIRRRRSSPSFRS